MHERQFFFKSMKLIILIEMFVQIKKGSTAVPGYLTIFFIKWIDNGKLIGYFRPLYHSLRMTVHFRGLSENEFLLRMMSCID